MPSKISNSNRQQNAVHFIGEYLHSEIWIPSVEQLKGKKSRVFIRFFLIFFTAMNFLRVTRRNQYTSIDGVRTVAVLDNRRRQHEMLPYDRPVLSDVAREAKRVAAEQRRAAARLRAEETEAAARREHEQELEKRNQEIRHEARVIVQNEIQQLREQFDLELRNAREVLEHRERAVQQRGGNDDEIEIRMHDR